MPAPKAAAKEMKEKGDISRPPDDSESSSEEDRAAIKPTVFARTSQEPVAQASKEPAAEAPKKKPGRGRPKKKIETVNGPKNDSKKSTKVTAPTKDNFSSSPKRKSQEDAPPLGSGMEDAFGQIKVKKPKRSYGSSQPTRSQPSSSASYGKNSKKDAGKQGLSTIPDSPQSPQSSGFKLHAAPDMETPVASPSKFNHINVPSPFKDEDEGSPVKEFKMPIADPSLTDDELSKPHLGLSPACAPKKRKKKVDEDPPPFTQFKAPILGDFDDDLAGTALGLLGEDLENLPPVHADEQDDDLFASLTQRARCPMCNKPVDPADLQEWGDMNTRQQERFCQFHQKKSAKEDWSLKGYPSIDWDNLGSRISKHYSFIKKVINGADSHYRDLLEEKVNAGKDRNLLKMTSNLTPGYYGGRGLRIMSENIMQKFTPQLKTKAVKDRRISSRGATAFVQSVLVPEVAVLLIMEDMNVEVEEARDILEDSAAIGELIHEEIRDVVKKRVEDSEDDEDDDLDD